MDKFIGQSQGDYPTSNNEENINNNEYNDDSAPPLISPNPESCEKPIVLQHETVDPFYQNTNSDNHNPINNIDNQQNIYNNRNIIRKKKYRKVTTARKVFQIIVCAILYILVLVCISFQIFDYGINFLAMIDDISIAALGTYILILSLKGYKTGSCKLGCITLIICFIGFGVRGVGSILVKRNLMKYIIIFLVRTIILIFATQFNFMPGEETIIYV